MPRPRPPSPPAQPAAAQPGVSMPAGVPARSPRPMDEEEIARRVEAFVRALDQGIRRRAAAGRATRAPRTVRELKYGRA